jgi:Acetokinase family
VFIDTRHNPANVNGIRLMRKILPIIPSVAVFDTSFHSSIPEKAYTYPLPSAYRALNMRKFGFHGTSVKFVCHRATAMLQNFKGDQEFNMVVCHLGSGASVTAIVGEKVCLLQEQKRGISGKSVLMSYHYRACDDITEYGHIHGIYSTCWPHDGHSMRLCGSIPGGLCM